MYKLPGWLILFSGILFLIACSSAPSPSLAKNKIVKSRAPASQKASVRVEAEKPVSMVNSQVLYSPRRFEELESAILVSKDVQNCLRLTPSGMVPLSIDIEGRISYTGDTEVTSIETTDALVKNCLAGALVLIKHGRGIQGPFKMRLERSLGPSGTGQGLILDKGSLKKFE